MDFALEKKFHITETKYLDFRTEFFNIFNHTSFRPSSRNISSPATFGVITSAVSQPRNIQFELKFFF